MKMKKVMPLFIKRTHKAFISVIAKTGTQPGVRINVLWNGYATISLNMFATARKI